MRTITLALLLALGATAQTEMAVGQGRGFGHCMPHEFRALASV